MTHHIRKFCSTISICARLLMACTFGEYQHTVFDGRMTYAKYFWRGKYWAVPTGAMKIEAHEHIGEVA